MSDQWPKLSEDLKRDRSPIHCQACGVVASHSLVRWQEHDGADEPSPVAVVLCESCSDRLIEAHPRLYRRLGRNEPFPGTMRICWECPHRDGVRCRSPLLRSNGGPGIRFPKADATIHVDGIRNGRRFGEWYKRWSAEPVHCEGKETT